MVAKYPGVTTARKQQGRRPRLPRDYRTGGRPQRFPQNDNVPLRGLSRAAMSMLARRLGLKLIPYGLGYLPEIIEAVKPWLRPYSVAKVAMPGAYWTVTCDTGGDMYSSLTVNFTCGAYQRVYDTQGDPFVNITMPANTTASKVEFFKDIGDNPGHPDPRYRIAQLAKIYQRVAGAPSPTPLRLNVPVPQPMEVPGQGYPMALPIAAPVGVPPAKAPVEKPRPGEQPNAEPEPEAEPHPWPRPNRYAVPANVPGIWTFPWPGTPNNPGVWPQPQTAVLTQPGGRSVGMPGAQQGSGRASHPGNPTRRPPPRGTKEKKVTVRSLGGLVWIGLNFATEGMDFAEALWDALPKQYQTPRASLSQKYEDLWKNFGQVDVAKAVTNFANQQIADIVYGVVYGTAGRNLNQLAGVNTGGTRALTQDGDISDLIPHIDFDPNTGVVSLTVPALGSASVNLGNRVF